MSTEIENKKVCKCGAEIIDNDVYYSNSCNEEGEDYSVYEFTCSNCGHNIEFSDWGECDDILEAIDKVADKIKEAE